ncbi:ribokinase [Siculibacillus lacustris]|uniref:Ribokinase n=1 Tax=Siculibacillus lacustris TaxID=1549641 RepID=A0A4Q9VVY3_9HYPH|nr:PfkB family carbohydrate kinase [Siculibacillus lacustris]TBW39233.1 ribokinase [Siculibacillus lacustris]
MIVVFGTINVDMVTRVPRLPGPGEEVKGRSYRLAPGGKGANQALAAVRAGARVALVGAVGDDPFATLALAGVAAAGVDLTRVAVVEMATGAHMVAVDPSAENMMIGADSANLAASAAQLDGAFGPGVVFLTQNSLSPEAVTAAIAAAKAAGARILFNAAPVHGTEDASFASAEVVVVNQHEARELAVRFGLPADPAAFARAFAVRFDAVTVVTLGGAGLVAATPDGRAWHGTPPPITAIDTTGAGDAFCGTLAAALDRGDGLETALCEGLAAGALACRESGAQSGLADLAAIRDAATRAVLTRDA